MKTGQDSQHCLLNHVLFNENDSFIYKVGQFLHKLLYGFLTQILKATFTQKYITYLLQQGITEVKDIFLIPAVRIILRPGSGTEKLEYS